jgi:hypothetical protein
MTSRRTVLRLLALGTPAGLAGVRTAQATEPNGPCDVSPMDLQIEWRSAAHGIDACRPRFGWTLAPRSAALRVLGQSAWQVIVARFPAAIRAGHGEIWDSGRCSSPALRVAPEHDLPLTSQSLYWWAVRVWDQRGRPSEFTPPVLFSTGVVQASDWRAQWISDGPDWPASPLPPPAINRSPPSEPRPMPLFRREFQVRKPLRCALLSVCGLGQYALHINGDPVSTSVLNPGWTDYTKTVLYDTFEVTSRLRPGTNVLGVLLGNGFFNVEKYPGRYTKFVGSFGRPKLIAQLRMLYADGSEDWVVSDASWDTHPGPIVLSSVYGGEDFDARRALPGWDRPGFAAAGWRRATQVRQPGGRLRAQTVPAVRAARTLKPMAVTQPKPGVFVYDLGENFSGWPVITVRGPAGCTVRLLPGELLQKDGCVTQRSAAATPSDAVWFTYTLAGTGLERWQPRFSYYGFRYVQVEGATPSDRQRSGVPELRSLEGQFLHDSLARIGTLEIGQPMLRRIHQLIVQALLSNSFSVLTDCPQREKLGWLEQTYLNADTVFYNEQAVTVYEKMLRDMMDSQRASGLVPSIAPEYVAFLDADGRNSAFRDSPEWGSAIVLSPWAAYRYTGDRRILATGYPAMCRYAAYLASRAHGDLLDYGLGDWFDWGPKPPGESQLTSKRLTASATYCRVLATLAAIARLLGYSTDAGRFARRAVTVRRALNRALFDPATHSYGSGSQTANAMPLAIGLVPAQERSAVLANLVADIRAHGNHVTAGDIGFLYVILALMQGGRADVLFDILTQTTAPSYGYQLARGATALTETWNANPDNSQNHFMLGQAEAWLYGGLAGLRIDQHRAAHERIRIEPQPVKGVRYAAVHYQGVFGEVSVRWVKNRTESRLRLRVSVPAGMLATLAIPCAEPSRIRAGGHALDNTYGVLHARRSAGRTLITVGSGHYVFDAPLV